MHFEYWALFGAIEYSYYNMYVGLNFFSKQWGNLTMSQKSMVYGRVCKQAPPKSKGETKHQRENSWRLKKAN